jgi:hypothetical protein
MEYLICTINEPEKSFSALALSLLTLVTASTVSVVTLGLISLV